MVQLMNNKHQSDPQTCYVTITPVNDEPPVIITNQMLTIWEFSVTPITASHLRVADKDTPDRDLMFTLSNPSNGELYLRDEPKKKILHFTQQHINRGEVMFQHKGWYNRKEVAISNQYFCFIVSTGFTLKMS